MAFDADADLIPLDTYLTAMLGGAVLSEHLGANRVAGTLFAAILVLHAANWMWKRWGADE